MSRWKMTLQSPLRGSSKRLPTDTMRCSEPCRSPTPSSIGNSAIGSASPECGSGDIPCEPAEIRLSARPAAFRCDAVA
jgi:hypothetical protein